MEYNRTFLRKLKENYFMSKALYETVKEQAEEIEKKIRAEVFPGQVLKQKEECVSAEKGKKTSKKSADSETNADLQNGLF